VDSVPATGAAILVFGQTGTANIAATSGQLIKQSLGWYRDAIVFANPPMLDLSPLVKMTAAESFEGYNILNHPHFQNPGTDAANTGNLIGQSQFGVITSTYQQPDGTTSARQVQVALKILF